MNINHTKMTLEINSCKNYEILEVRQGDKGSRIIDFAFTVNGEIVDLASTMSAKVNATVDDVIVAEDVAAVVDTENNVVTVTLTDTMLALSGICKMDIVLTEGDEIITAETVCLRVGKSVINDDSKAFPGASSIAEITKEVENARGDSADLNTRFTADEASIEAVKSEIATARGGQKSLGARLDTVDTNFAKKANKANTLAGYGIMDGIKDAAGTVRAVNLAADVINKFGEKVDSSELFDVTKSINLANLADYSQHQNGVTVTVAKGKISLSGTSTAATNFFLPLKSSITLRIDTPYCLSLQDFTTNNTGCVFYPAYNQNVIDSKWLLSEVSALKNAAATFTPIQYMFVNSIKIAIAANRLTDNSCHLQIEQNNQKTAYVDPEKIVKKIKPTLYQGPDYAMHYLYVSNDYNEDTEGYGETKFNSILSANNSISDNSYHNRYTIVVMAGTYTDLQDKYAGMSDVGLVGYRGVMTKDYVYYESENIYNPAATVIKWDGATGFDKSKLKSEDIIKKCPFHLDLNVHTHIRGFTFDCKNIRYGMHLESGGTGYATNWNVGHCTFIWGGRADCVDYANKTTVPVFGCGHSFGEVGLIENCKIIPTHCTIGYQNHDNADNSDFGLPIKVGAKITFKDCDFGGTEIQARTLKGAYADTPNVLTIDNCINISAINKMYAAPADHCDWIVNTINSKNEQN